MGKEGAKQFLYLSIFGLILGSISHFITYFGINPNNYFSPIWILHILSVIVGAPAITIFRKTKVELKKLLKITLISLLLYAVVNFVIYINVVDGQEPEIEQGRYVLVRKGVITRELDKNEYDKYCIYDFREKTGHWTLIYLFSSIIYVFAVKNNGVDDDVWVD